MGDTTNLTLGTGVIYINDVDVGFLEGDVEFSYERMRLDFKPSGALGPVKQFIIGERAVLKASQAEFSVAKYKQALGLTDTVDTSWTGDPSYNPASFTAESGSTYSMLKFGGSTTLDNTMAIRFEHTRSGGTKKVVVILYTASAEGLQNLVFKKEELLLTDVEFVGLANTDRTAGDQIGMVLEETTQT